MYERFTDRARKVMQLANQEAQRLRHEYIGTDHILLGLAKEGTGVAVYVLKSLGVEPRAITRAVESLIQGGPPGGEIDETLPRTPRAKTVIQYAMEEARNLNHTYVGTEHILLGLLREGEGVAAQVLMTFGLQLEKLQEAIRSGLRHSPHSRTHWGVASPLSGVRRLDEDTKRRVRELADAIAPLQLAKERAVARREFEQAAELRDKQDRSWKELGNLNPPEWVLTNVKRLANAWPAQTSRFAQVLDDMFHDEPGEPDTAVSSLLPNPLIPPVKIMVGAVPRFLVSTLKVVLAPNDICSPYFQAVVPLISPESVARFKDNHRAWVQMAFKDISRAKDPVWGCAVLLCVARPALLSQDVREELFAGLDQTNCDFVVFEAADDAHSLLGNLPRGTKLLEFQ